jgi:hypothetical protein
MVYGGEKKNKIKAWMMTESDQENGNRMCININWKQEISMATKIKLHLDLITYKHTCWPWQNGHTYWVKTADVLFGDFLHNINEHERSCPWQISDTTHIIQPHTPTRVSRNQRIHDCSILITHKHMHTCTMHARSQTFSLFLLSLSHSIHQIAST